MIFNSYVFRASKGSKRHTRSPEHLRWSMAPEKMFRNWSRRTGEQAAKMCHDVPCAKWERSGRTNCKTSRAQFSDLLGSSRAQDLTAGHWARSYKAGVKPFFFGQNTKITIGIFEIFIRYIIDVILRYTIADDTLITLRKDFTSETDLHLKQLLTEVRYTSDDD